MTMDCLRSLVEASLKHGCSEAQAWAVKGFNTQVGFDFDNPRRSHTSWDVTALQVIHEGRLGSSRLFSRGISAYPMVMLAIASSRYNGGESSSFAYAFPTESICFEDTDSPTQEARNMESEEKWEQLSNWVSAQNCEVSQIDDIEVISSMLTYETFAFSIVNSKGLNGSYSNSSSKMLGCVRASNEEQAPISVYCVDAIGTSENIMSRLLDTNFLDQIETRRTMESGLLYGRVKFSYLAASQLFSLVVQALSGALVSTNQSYLKIDDIGVSRFDDSLSIADNPITRGGAFYSPFDAEGIVTSQKCLVESGRIIGFLCNTSSAKMLGQSAGNCFVKPPDFLYRVQHTNICVTIERTADQETDILITDLGSETVFNPSSGMLQGVIYGFQVHGSSRTPKKFFLSRSIDEILATVYRCNDAKWVGCVSVPEFISVFYS